MNDQSWWIWGAKIFGTLTFFGAVIYYFREKKKIPLYVYALSLIAFVCGMAIGFTIHLKFIHVLALGLLCSVAPPVLWFFCGGPFFSQEDAFISQDRKK